MRRSKDIQCVWKILEEADEDPNNSENIEQAQELTTKWLWTYNNKRPHSSVGRVPPRYLLSAF